jgi:hypothetical protein
LQGIGKQKNGNGIAHYVCKKSQAIHTQANHQSQRDIFDIPSEKHHQQHGVDEITNQYKEMIIVKNRLTTQHQKHKSTLKRKTRKT